MNVDYLLKELKNIKTVNENITILSNNLTTYKKMKEKKDIAAKNKAKAAESDLYEKEAKKILKTPFPSIKIEAKDDESISYPNVTNPSIEYKWLRNGDFEKSVKQNFLLYLISRIGVFISISLIVLFAVLSWIGPASISNFITVCCWLAIGFGVLWVITLTGSHDVVVKLKKYVEQFEKNEQAYKDWDLMTQSYIDEMDTDNYKAKVENVFEISKEFHKEFLALVDVCDVAAEPIREEYKRNLQDNENEFINIQNQIKAKIEDCEKYLSAVTIIHPSMFDKIDKISNVLELGRADSIKEAVNIVIDDERRESEEEERRREAARRQAVLEAQAYEAKRHNEAMENQAREAQEAANKKAEEDERLRKEELRKNRSAAINRCVYCIHSSKCHYDLKKRYQDSGQICPNYVPEKR